MLDKLPEGWRVDKTAGSPLHGYEFCTNGKSVLSGQQERGLVRVTTKKGCFFSEKPNQRELKLEVKGEEFEQVIDENFTWTVNQLARESFKARLLNDILIDLHVCEIEGWSKVEYIGELRRLINGIGGDV